MLRAGFLQTSRSKAVARLECLPPCSCKPILLSAYTPKYLLSITVLSQEVRFDTAGDAAESCHVQLVLQSDGERFKLISLAVT